MNNNKIISVSTNSNNITAYRIVLLGSSGIGKRALILRFINGSQRHSKRFDATVEDSYRKKVEIEDRSYILDITNILGGEIKSDQNVKDADGVILAYNITSTESFDQLSTLRNLVYRARGETYNVPTIIAGIRSEIDDIRMIEKEMGQTTAEKWRTGFIEVSTKSSKAITKMFCELIHMIDEWRINHPKKEEIKKNVACILL